MINSRRSNDFVACFRDFARGRSGVAAVEFAIMLPFMLAIYFGGIEIGNGVAIHRKVVITSRALADIASQYTAIASADMIKILGASSTIIAPYPSGPLSITVSEITTTKSKSTVLWSYSRGGTALVFGSTFTLPGQLPALDPNGASKPWSLIFAQAAYAYTPTLGYKMTGTLNLPSQIFMSPRQSSCITRSDDPSALPCP
jgi:Flp pilus assembly protein TadG